jgi:hypothetical protein
VSTPYPQPFAPPPGADGPPTKARPSAWWFALPAVMFVAAVAIVAVGLLTPVAAVFHTDAAVPIDGQLHAVALDGTADRTLWAPTQGIPEGTRCNVLDATTRQSIPLRLPDSTVERHRSGVDERAAYIFSPSSANLLVVCSGAQPGQVLPPDLYIEIGPAVGFRGAAGSLVGGIVLVLLAAAILLVLVVLFATRGPRDAPTMPTTPTTPSD